MARAAAFPPSRSSPTLPLLPLLLLLLREIGAQDVQVRVPPEVRGYLGGTVQLPCHLLPPGPEVRVSQVTWLHVDAAGTSKSVAAFHPSYGPSFRGPKPGEERLSFVTAGQSTGTRQGTEIELRDATLALRGLTVEDEGNYTCEFATFPSGTSRGVTWLRAIAQPQNHAETQEVTLSLEPMPVARCVSEGGRPPARISWVSSLDGEGRQSQMSGPVPGTFTVTSRYTLVPLSRVDGVKVTCKVEHESFEEPILLPVTLSVRYPPEVSISGYDDNWYLGRSEATLSCDVRSKPEPTGYDWSTTSGSLPPSAAAQNSQLLIQTVDESINTTFICRVTNTLGTGQAELTIQVREEPPNQVLQPGLSTVSIIILTVGVVVGVALPVFLIYSRLFRRPRRDQHSSSANGYVSYTVVDTNVSSSQDPPREHQVTASGRLERETGAGEDIALAAGS